MEFSTFSIEIVLVLGHGCWFAAGGVPCALAYKAVNTLDSMIGHPEPPYHYFGRVAARLDDAVNLIPARLTALGIVAGAMIHGLNPKNPGSPFRDSKVNMCGDGSGGLRRGYASRFRRIAPTRPSKPVPSKANEEGSGVCSGADAYASPRSVPSTFSRTIANSLPGWPWYPGLTRLFTLVNPEASVSVNVRSESGAGGVMETSWLSISLSKQSSPKLPLM